MTAERIRQIVRLIGLHSPYWRRVRSASAHPLPLALRLLIALADPAFGWHLALSYADAGLPLPVGLSESAIVRAYRYLRDPYRRDVHVLLAHELTKPARQRQRNFLRALLLCNTTLDQIAEDCGEPVDVVELFEGLFWNCRDRLNERVYLARICNQGVFGRTAGAPSTEALMADPVRVAYRSGRIEDVLAEVEPPPMRRSPTEGYKLVEQEILARAAMELKLDRVSPSENPALIPALKLMVQMKRAAQRIETGPVSGPEAAGAIAMSSHGITEQEEQYQTAVFNQNRLASQQSPPQSQSGTIPNSPSAPPAS
jgi:hypothetical protein